MVRSSDKNDLGLSELHQLNVKERYNIFENAKRDDTHYMLDREERILKRGTTVLSKMAKYVLTQSECVALHCTHTNTFQIFHICVCDATRFKAKGMDVGDAEGIIGTDDLPEDEDYDVEGEDIDLIRAKEAQRERPVCLANMDDIKSKFESGHSQSKEERREERKQEIQNIRSRLFMGKQARIKEMYQQAVAESEQCTFLKSTKAK